MSTRDPPQAVKLGLPVLSLSSLAWSCRFSQDLPTGSTKNRAC